MSKAKFLFSMLYRRLSGQPKKCPYCGSLKTNLLQRKKLFLDLRKCSECSLRFRYPTDDVFVNEAFYQEDYDDGPQSEVPSETALNEMLRNQFRGSPVDLSVKISVLKRHVASGKVLDYGCSWGYGVKQLQFAGYDAIGFEISKPRAKFANERLGVNAICDLGELKSMEKGSLDGIFTSHVMEHLPQVKETLDLFEHLLRPGGKLLIYVPNGGGKEARELGVRWLTLIGENHTLALDSHFFAHALPLHSINPVFGSQAGEVAPIPYSQLGENATFLDGEELMVVGTKMPG